MRSVPARVPSVIHSSFPVLPSSATKYRVVLSGVRALGGRVPGVVPLAISVTSVVPGSVPSLFQIWRLAPAVRSFGATKYSSPFMLVKSAA